MNVSGVNSNFTKYNYNIGLAKEKGNLPVYNQTTAGGVYPVYLKPPHGIKPYFKIEEFVLPTGDKVCTYKLITGQTISIVQKDGCPVIKTAFKVGSMDEPDGKEGMSHFIEHSIFHSSKKYDDVDQAIKNIGGTSNASTSFNITDYYIKLGTNDKKVIKQALDIEADMVFNPKFSKLDKERNIVIKESEQCETNEKRVILNQSIKNIFSINKPNIDVNCGNKNSINSITYDDMINYHKEYYIPKNAATSIVTPYNPDEIIDMAANSFIQASENIVNHPIKRQTYNYINQIERRDIISKESDKKDIAFDFLFPMVNDSDRAKAFVMYKWIAKESDFSFSFREIYGNNNILSFQYTGNEEDEYSAFENLKEQFIKLSAKQLDEVELEKIKKEVIKKLEDYYQNADSITETLNYDYLDSSYSYEKIKNAINNLKPEDIQDFVKHFDLAKCSMCVVHPKGTTKKDLEDNIAKYKNYITPVIIPKTVQNIDISNAVKEYNISPYYSERVLNATLPDNTNLTLLNSKTDKCSAKWVISNPDLANSNPALKYILSSMLNGSIFDIFENKSKYEMLILSEYSEPYRIEISAGFKAKNLDFAIKKMKKCFDIKFTEEEFEKAKKEALDSIKNDSDAETVANRYYADKHGINCSYNKDKLIKGLEKLTFNDVKSYYNALITGGNSIFVIKAPFDKNKGMINQIASTVNIPGFKFKKKDGIKSIYKANQPKKCYIKEKNQPSYRNMYTYKISGNKTDGIKCKVLGEILSQRLFNSLREKMGMAYSVNANGDEYYDIGSISLNVTTCLKDRKDIEKIFAEFDKEVQRLIKEPVSEKELKEAKNNIKVQILDSSSSESDFIYMISNSYREKLGLGQMEGHAEILDAITKDDIMQTASYVFKDKPDYLIEADKKTIDDNIEYFKKLGEIVNA